MTTPHYQHLFGPVPSRRFGRSLGIDLIPFKTCSYDCVFCQLGRTTRKTIERREYVPVASVIAELETWLKDGGQADYITLAGSGEPTLNSGFGRVIEYLRGATDIPVALLTNGSLLSDPEVRAQAASAHVVKISLSAWDQQSLEWINRPDDRLRFTDLVEGERLLCNEAQGDVWLEVFLVNGANTTTRDVANIARLVETIGPTKVHLNTAVRPPCESFVHLVPRHQLQEMAQQFSPPAEVIADYDSLSEANQRVTESDILEMIQRRPCTLEDICQAFGLHRNEASKYVGRLTRQEQIIEHRQPDEIFYAGIHSSEKGNGSA